MLFAVGSSQGTTGCVDIVLADDNVTEGLECFSFSLNDMFVPVCIEDDDRT